MDSNPLALYLVLSKWASPTRPHPSPCGLENIWVRPGSAWPYMSHGLGLGQPTKIKEKKGRGRQLASLSRASRRLIKVFDYSPLPRPEGTKEVEAKVKEARIAEEARVTRGGWRRLELGDEGWRGREMRPEGIEEAEIVGDQRRS